MEDLEIIKAFDILDKMEFFGGQRAGRELWFNKPIDIQDKDIGNFLRDIDFLKIFIDSQQAEIERLQKYNTDVAFKHYEDGKKDAAKEIINHGYRKQSEWISVEERLPKTNQQVLVFGMRGSIRVCIYESRYDKHFRVIKTAFYRNDDKKAMNVRYWMPLPEPPKMR